MHTIVQRPYGLRFLLSLALLAAIAFNFWTTSRYPSLDDKAMMSGAIQLEDPLGFEAKYPLTQQMTTAERVFYTTLNWIHTNLKGMTFGILFAAAFLTLASYLKRRSFQSPWANSTLGLFIGAPLGVCVNCAAPIAKGMYAAGLRAETTLSAMIASPTLNVVVLTMLFSLLPVYMALTKIALSLVLILVAVPLICRLLPGERLELPRDKVPAPTFFAAESGAAHEGIFAALFGTALAYAKNLAYIVALTVPLMLLAGFLGALVATFLPQTLLLALPFTLWILILVALVGVFLPVPIAFDVVVTGALLAAGLDPGYVMALLFTLGSFSIYSYFIVAQAISLRAATLLALAVVVAGILSGLFAQAYHDWQTERALRALTAFRLLGAAHAAEHGPTVITPDAARIFVEARPFAARSAPGEKPFTRIEAVEAGIDKPVEFQLYDMWPPFWEGRSLSTGDIDGDGDLDLVIASTEVGLYLYANDGAGRFARIPADLGRFAEMEVFNAALVDIDNDGWRDLFLATYRTGNWIVPNRAGAFDFAAAALVANRPNAVLSIALAFADADRDGDLDVALGNWAAGWYRRVPGEESRNRIVWNQAGQVTGEAFTDLPGIPGETLSILFADFTGDGLVDLIEGNDFEQPDIFYEATAPVEFRMIEHAEGRIPHATTTTMAVKVADLQNDGAPEIYLAQIAGRSSGVSQTLKMQPLEDYCTNVRDPQARQTCERNMAIKSWYKSGNNFDPTYASRCAEFTGPEQDRCKAMLLKDIAIQRDDPSICGLIPPAQDRARSYCEIHFWPIRPVTAAEAEAAIPQVLRSNVLLVPIGDGRFSDEAEARGLHVGGWSWDVKIADFDLDGDQDVYIVNGTWVPNEVSPSNLFFLNDGTGNFTEVSGPFGLEDYLMTAAATQFDMDFDGDLDLLSQPVNGPVALFVNNAQAGNAIAFAFDDRQGNRDGIGALVTIRLSDGSAQSREVQMGGGFMSFDAAWAHFGLGQATEIAGAHILWADGSETQIDGPISAGALYTIRREAP